MSELVLQARAEKIVNKGGGIRTKTEVEVTPKKVGEVSWPAGSRLSKRNRLEVWVRRFIKSTPDSGSDYIVFKCAHCGTRNRKCAYDAKYSAPEMMAFRCHRCRSITEVARPAPRILSPSEALVSLHRKSQKPTPSGIVIAGR